MIGNLTFAANAEKWQFRASFAFFGVALAIVAVSVALLRIQGRHLGDPATWVLFSAGVLTFVMGGLIPWTVNQQGADDWLRLGPDGLTLRRRGREHSWPWECLVDVRRHGRLHPAAPFLGRFVAVGVKDGGGPPFPGGIIRMLLPRNTIAIGDEFITPSDRIASLLSAAIAEADADREMPDDSLLEAKAPEIFILRAPGHYKRLLKLLAATLGSVAAVALLFTFLTIGSDERNHHFTVSVIVSIAVGIQCVMPMFQSGYPRDFLLLSDDGLTVRQEGRRWLWAWADVTEIGPIKDTETDPKSPKAEPGPQFTIHIRPETAKSRTQTVPTPTEVTVKGSYDAPIETIARALTERWNRGQRMGGAG